MAIQTSIGPPLLDAEAPRAAPEATRARYPDAEGFVERDGMRLFYEVYGEGEETLFLIPTWSLVHSRHWKMQIPYFARHFRVLTMDGLGNGRSERCRDPRRYGATEFARDCLAVMDATRTERAVMVSLSKGAQFLLELARLAPERVASRRRALPASPAPVPARSPRAKLRGALRVRFSWAAGGCGPLRAFPRTPPSAGRSPRHWSPRRGAPARAALAR